MKYNINLTTKRPETSAIIKITIVSNVSPKLLDDTAIYNNHAIIITHRKLMKSSRAYTRLNLDMTPVPLQERQPT